MIFDHEFLQGIDSDPINAVIDACDRIVTQIESEPSQQWSRDELSALMECVALVDQIITTHSLHSENVVPEISRSFEHNCQHFLTYLNNVQNEFQAQAFELQFSSLQDKYRTVLRSNFAYEFSQGDLDRIQNLLNELRAQISECSDLEVNHRQRLLARLEKLQSELHKRVSDLDRFWGLVGDAGVVLGKLGKDAKPIFDRIREISDIVWRTQARTEELPSGTPPPLLGNGRPTEDE